MTHYDPDIPPDSTEWLALDEQHRIRLVETYHRPDRATLPNVMAHAVLHTIVENQLAEELEPVVRAMARLMNEGLSRHDAVHAIGSVIASHLFEAMNAKGGDRGRTAQAHYNAAVERLTAHEWKTRNAEHDG